MFPLYHIMAQWIRNWQAFQGTYGISSGSTSASMLMESVLALDVGAAASRIFSRAIYRETKYDGVI